MSVAVDLQDVEQPVRELDVAVARPLGMAQRLDEGLVAEPVQLSGDCFQTDIGHGFTSSAPRLAPPLCVYAVRRSAGWKRVSHR